MATQRNEVEVLIELKDQISTTLNKINGNTSDFSKTAQKTTVSTRSMSKGMDLLKKAFVGYIGVAGAIKALDFIKDINAQKDAILNLSNATGTSVKQLSRLDYIAKINKTSLSDVTSSINILTRNIGTASAGVNKQSKAFASLGVSLNNPNGELRDINDLFLDSIDALSKVENSTDRAILAQNIFGRGAKKLGSLIKGGREEFEKLSKEADDLGVSFDRLSAEKSAQFNDAMERMGQSAKGLGMAMAEELTPILTAIADNITIIVRGLGEISRRASYGKEEEERTALENTNKVIEKQFKLKKALKDQLRWQKGDTIALAEGNFTREEVNYAIDQLELKIKDYQDRAKKFASKIQNRDIDRSVFGLKPDQAKSTGEDVARKITTSTNEALKKETVWFSPKISNEWRNEYKDVAMENVKKKMLAIEEEQQHKMNAMKQVDKMIEEDKLRLKQEQIEQEQQLLQMQQMELQKAQELQGGMITMLQGISALANTSNSELGKMLEILTKIAITVGVVSSATNPLSAIGLGLGGVASLLNGFSWGGTVGGGSTSGDNQMVRVNRGEEIMTQSEAISLRKNSAIGGGGIVVNVSGNVGTNEKKLAQMTANAISRITSSNVPARAF